MIEPQILGYISNTSYKENDVILDNDRNIISEQCSLSEERREEKNIKENKSNSAHQTNNVIELQRVPRSERNNECKPMQDGIMYRNNVNIPQQCTMASDKGNPVCIYYTSFRGFVAIFWFMCIVILLMCWPTFHGLQALLPVIFGALSTITHRVIVRDKSVILQLGPVPTCVFTKVIKFEKILSVHLTGDHESRKLLPVTVWAFALTRGAEVVTLKTKDKEIFKISVQNGIEFLMALDNPGDPLHAPQDTWVLCDLLA